MICQKDSAPYVCPRRDEQNHKIQDEHKPVDDLEVPPVQIRCKLCVLLAEFIVSHERLRHDGPPFQVPNETDYLVGEYMENRVVGKSKGASLVMLCQDRGPPSGIR